LTDLFPWQHSGAQFKRTWPIAPERALLERRWESLLSAPAVERAELFRETRDRKIRRAYPALVGGDEQAPLAELDAHAPSAAIAPYAYRSLDRQYCIADSRAGDFLRPALWGTLSARQLFLTSQITDVLGDGPAAMATNLVPDMHFFAGRGAKDVVPLWRDNAASNPNIAAGMLDALGHALGVEVSPEDLFAYVYALLGSPTYTGRFAAELAVPGPRIPLTREASLFTQAAELGRKLIWLHTFGERFVPLGERAGSIPQGRARATQPVPADPDRYPTEHRYDVERQELHVGEGVFAPVDREVNSYSISGLDVVGSWLDYRMLEGAGRRSSYLDTIRPSSWPAAFTEELLRLLWVIEHTSALTPELNAVLDAVVNGSTFAASDLPQPTEAERQPPS
jgi:hypothetical protein